MFAMLCADVRTSKHFPPAKEKKNFVGWATVFGIQNKVMTLSNVVVVVVKKKIFCCKIEKCVNFERLGLYVDLERDKQNG